MSSTLLEKLRKALPEQDVPAVEDCMTRLLAALPDQDRLSRNIVMVAYGGGKDSAYTTAFMRAVHLSTAERTGGDTFRLRVATMRHAGMPYVVMQNIDRSYRALGLYGDERAELLLIERDKVRSFRRDAPMPITVSEFNRIDLLMSGHRTYGDGRSTFCNACNLNVADSFGVASSYGDGVDLIVTGDSPAEQRDYARWIRSLAARAGLPAVNRKNFKGTLETLNGLSRAYFSEIYGPEQSYRLARRAVTTNVRDELAFFSIYNHTSYASGAHWRLLTDFLGFVFDEVAFNFTESDCANPALMAHLRGLRVERVYGRSYREGIEQYLDFALDLMIRKDFPDHLVDEMRQRYATEDGVAAMRATATRYGEDTFGLGDTQLVCMVYSPFAGGAVNLQNYLAREMPHLLDQEDEIRALLKGAAGASPALAAELERISGLSLTDLRQLHEGPLWSPFAPVGNQPGVLPLVMDSDPHQKRIRVARTPAGEEVLDRVSGR